MPEERFTVTIELVRDGNELTITLDVTREKLMDNPLLASILALYDLSGMNK